MWFDVWRRVVIGLILVAHPIRARQPQGASSNDAKASVTGRITVVSGDGVTNTLPGATVKLSSPSLGQAPQSTVTHPDLHYESNHYLPANPPPQPSPHTSNTFT